MNKKLAMLMLAIGLGAATAPAFALECGVYCARGFSACFGKEGYDQLLCVDTYEACLDNCPQVGYP